MGDRQWIESYELLQNLTKFEESIGLEFTHIRLLARAFTDRSIGYTHLTLGSNQRLEFLGDTVLQLICSEFLYRHFPEHHEGHLSLLRSSLVNNRTQAVVCDDLGMTKFAVYSNPKAELKTKDRADLLEALLGAIYVDKGIEFCEVFCHTCLFPRLQDFIMNQDWNDPKSKLQQCCLTLRTMDGGEPDIPVYKVIECSGPTNTRVYSVAVYFRGKRLACATGHSIQQAEMNAAKTALENSKDLFPQLDHQKRVIAKSLKRQKVSPSDIDDSHNDSFEDVKNRLRRRQEMDESNLPKQYRLLKKYSSSSSSTSSSSDMNDSTDNSDDDDDDEDPRRQRHKRKLKPRKESVAKQGKTKENPTIVSTLKDANFSSLSEDDNLDAFDDEMSVIKNEPFCSDEIKNITKNENHYDDENIGTFNETSEIKIESISGDEIESSSENHNKDVDNGGMRVIKQEPISEVKIEKFPINEDNIQEKVENNRARTLDKLIKVELLTEDFSSDLEPGEID